MTILRHLIYSRTTIGALFRTPVFLRAITIAAITLMTLPSGSAAQGFPPLSRALNVKAEVPRKLKPESPGAVSQFDELYRASCRFDFLVSP